MSFFINSDELWSWPPLFLLDYAPGLGEPNPCNETFSQVDQTKYWSYVLANSIKAEFFKFEY